MTSTELSQRMSFSKRLVGLGRRLYSGSAKHTGENLDEKKG